MNYCSQCGSSKIVLKIPADDNRQRQVCEDCGVIHYRNPKIIGGCLLTWEDKVLLACRSIQPRKGFWTLPAGFMELGESVAEGAARECWEETRSRPVNMQLYGIFSMPRISQVYMMYRGEVSKGEYAIGEESSDVGLFAEADIPWNDLAFPIVTQTLRQFFADRADKQFSVFEQIIEIPARSSPL
jgi:ADP-ribose pyrophosphatase YjhB (NUDIX family)